MSVQHGRAPKLVAEAVQKVGPLPPSASAEFDRRLINMLYDVREAYVDRIKMSRLKKRYRTERPEALRAVVG
jgi:hypothetical protein